MSLIDRLKSQRETATRIADFWTQFEDIEAGKLLKNKPDLKLATLRLIRFDLTIIEGDAVRHGKINLADLRELRNLLPKVDAAISRCEAGKKRREENAEERAQYE